MASSADTRAAEAEAVAARLAARGIEALVGPSSGLDVARPGGPAAPIPVSVAAEVATTARAVLDEPVEVDEGHEPAARSRMPWLARVAFVAAVTLVIALVAWALSLMQAAIEQREFSLMLAGCLVCSAAVGLTLVMVMALNGMPV